jgi:hypothetical protein
VNEADVATDFLYELDDGCYVDFKVGIINDIDQGAIEAPDTVNQMYPLVSCDKAPRRGVHRSFVCSNA